MGSGLFKAYGLDRVLGPRAPSSQNSVVGNSDYKEKMQSDDHSSKTASWKTRIKLLLMKI